MVYMFFIYTSYLTFINVEVLLLYCTYMGYINIFLFFISIWLKVTVWANMYKTFTGCEKKFWNGLFMYVKFKRYVFVFWIEVFFFYIFSTYFYIFMTKNEIFPFLQSRRSHALVKAHDGKAVMKIAKKFEKSQSTFSNILKYYKNFKELFDK